MKIGHAEKGASLVEAAVVIPFLILLVFGTIDLARGFFDAAKVQEVAQEGAVYAGLNPAAPADTIARAEETIDSPDFTGSITVTCPANDQVAVTVTYNFNVITPVISAIVGSPLDLSHTETAQVLSSDACVPSP